jgi:hypothetical protein
MGERNARLLKLSPQKVAWIVLLTSFVIFCTVCAAGTFGAYWFFFQSSTSMTIRLTVSRGTVTMTLSDGTNTAIDKSAENLSANASYQTASNAEGYLTFEDPYSNQTIATVFLMPNSNTRLVEATRPRFEWSQRSYLVSLNDASGQFAVELPPESSRTIVLTIRPTSEIGTARFDESGSYMLDAFDQYLKLYTEKGLGLLYAASGHGWQVAAGMEGTLAEPEARIHMTETANPTLTATLARGESDRMTQTAAFSTLVATLARGEPEASIRPYPYQNIIVEDINTDQSPPVTNSFGNDDETRLPSGWACANPVVDQNEPAGSWSRALVDQRMTLRMSRLSQSGQLISHAETGCEFWFKSQTGANAAIQSTPGPAPTATATAVPTAVSATAQVTQQATAVAAATAQVTEQPTAAATPGESPAEATFGPMTGSSPAGWNVTGYKSLSIRLKMKINFQNVNTCGVQGTECPVMILVEYCPPNDLRCTGDDPVVQVWRQGFYAVRPPDDTSLQRCDTCPHDHEQINLGAWYIYNSNDLFREFLEERKPVSIVRIRVYSSGHEYDVMLADLAVLGGL